MSETGKRSDSQPPDDGVGLEKAKQRGSETEFIEEIPDPEKPPGGGGDP